MGMFSLQLESGPQATHHCLSSISLFLHPFRETNSQSMIYSSTYIYYARGYIYIGEDQECVVFLHMFSLIYIDVCAERDKYSIDKNNAKDCRLLCILMGIQPQIHFYLIFLCWCTETETIFIYINSVFSI